MAGVVRPTAVLYTDLTGFPSPAARVPGSSGGVPGDLRELLRAKFQEFHGEEARTVGDAFLVEFSSAVDAVRCAVEIQGALRAVNRGRPSARRLSLQIGVHVGTLLRSGWDVAGEAVDVVGWI